MKNFWNPIYIGGRENPYLIRRILFSCPWFGMMLHKICRSDYERALHDHPWGFVSLILSAGYWEEYGDPERTRTEFRPPWSVLCRPATWRHRVIIEPGAKPAWTLVLKGPRERKWGFWVEEHSRRGFGGPGILRCRFNWCWWRKYNWNLDICETEIIHTDGED